MAVFARGLGATYTVTFPGALPIEPPAVFHSNLVLVDSNNVTFAQSPIIARGPATYAIGTQLLVADFFQGAVLTTTLATLSTPFAAWVSPLPQTARSTSTAERSW